MVILEQIYSRVTKINKTSIFIIVLLAFLVVPRITVYLNEGSGSYGTDALNRYFPQVEEQSMSWKSFFYQTGPAYSLFLLFFKKITKNMVVGPVIFQHIFGIISALLTFSLFKKINNLYAFAVSFLVFVSQMAIALEHTILRDSFASFLLVLLVFMISIEVDRKKEPKLNIAILRGLLLGLVGLVLCLVRIEFAVLVAVFPFYYYLVEKKRDYFLRYLIGFLLPFILFAGAHFFAGGGLRNNQYTGSYFNVAYHGLKPSVFYYDNSNHPDLLRSYQKILEKNKTVTNSMGSFYTVTREYLSKHPKIKLNFLQLMDRMYIEMVAKNPVEYFKSYSANLKSLALGADGKYNLINNVHPTGIKIFDMLIRFFTFHLFVINRNILDQIMVYLFLLMLPFLLIKIKNLRQIITLSAIVTIVQLMVLSAFANPEVRFRYPIDPFLYSVPLFGLFLIFSKLINVIRKPNDGQA